VVGRDGSIGRHEGGGWSNRCRKIQPVSACWLEEVSVEMADSVGIGCQMGKLIAIGDKAGIMR